MAYNDQREARPARQNRPKIGYKPKKWSHQDELTALKGQKIVLGLNEPDISEVFGVLEEADQYFIKVRLEPIPGKPLFVIYNKSSVTYFCKGA